MRPPSIGPATRRAAAFAFAALTFAALASSAFATAAVAATPPAAGAAPALSGHERDGMLVATAWLARHLDDPGVLVLHVGRARDGYDAGHIPGARFVGFKDVAVERDGVTNEVPPVADLVELGRRLGFDDRVRLVLYDDEAGLIAARVFVVLDYLGLGDRTAILDGHLGRWRAERRPLSTAVPVVTPTAWVPRLHPEVIVALEAVRDLSWAATHGARGAALIDARPEAQYAGTASDGSSRTGHIPGATSLYWPRMLVSKEDPVLRPPDELRALFTGAGAATGDLVVSYCHSGVQASYTYFVARYLGYDARLYDGSFAEWSARADTPVEAAPAEGAPAAAKP